MKNSGLLVLSLILATLLVACASADPAPKRSPALQALLRSIHASYAQADKIPLAKRRQIYYQVTAVDNKAAKRGDPDIESAEAPIRRRQHISQDVLSAISAEGTQHHWPRAP